MLKLVRTATSLPCMSQTFPVLPVLSPEPASVVCSSSIHSLKSGGRRKRKLNSKVEKEDASCRERDEKLNGTAPSVASMKKATAASWTPLASASFG